MLRFCQTLTLCCVVLVSACQQTKVYTPELAPVPVQLPMLAGVSVVVNDLRAERPDGESMRRRLHQQLSQAIPQVRALGDTTLPRLEIDVVEQRSFFTLGNWNGATRLRAILVKPTGTDGPWEASGTSRRANSMGYSTAKRVAQDSYSAAISDLVSRLRVAKP